MDIIKIKFKQYFKHVDMFVNRWNGFLFKSEKPLSVVSNLTEHLHIILRADLNKEMLDLFPDVQKKLVEKFYILLEEELTVLQKLQNEMYQSNTDLRNRLTQLEQSYRQYQNNETKQNENEEKKVIIVGDSVDPLCPPCYELLEMAFHVWTYYHNLWLSINAALLCLDYEDSKTVKILLDAFKEDSMEKQHIYRIQSMTKYLIS